jgi:very-short-patch-repair endonuclease
LRPYWTPHIVFEEFPVFGSKLKVDILNATMKIAVEVNGKQHEGYNKFFHRGNPANYLRGFHNDEKKFQWLKRNGYFLVEIGEDEVNDLSRRFFLEKFGITL